jgi:hypothetical protein
MKEPPKEVAFKSAVTFISESPTTSSVKIAFSSTLSESFLAEKPSSSATCTTVYIDLKGFEN